MGPLTEKGEGTRERILLAARHAFAERGYDGASLNDVIRSAEITKGGFYFHFPSKADLALAVIDETKLRVQDEILAHVRGETGIERLVGLIEGAFAICDGGDEMEAISRLVDALLRDEQTAGAVQRPWEQWEQVAAELIRQAQAEGDVPAEIDPDASATIAVGTYFGLELMHRDDPARMRELRDPYTEFVLTALRARRQPE